MNVLQRQKLAAAIGISTDALGKMVSKEKEAVTLAGELEKQIDILSAEDIKRANVFSRMFRSLNYLVWGDV